MKKVVIVHGWEGNPENCWFPWLKSELEKRNFKVIIPEMPNTDEPEIESWVEKLKEISGNVDEDTYFIGHSIGCQAIMRYLETLPENTKLGKVIFVAGFFNLPNLETEEERIIAKPWLEDNIDTEKIRNIPKEIIAIFSDNDPEVPLSDKELFEEELNAKIIISHGKGHFSDDDGIKELPEVLESLK